ncbi:MAG: outer membrane channel protein [Bacteroidetes bacterium]|nr:MAG: outer membrane channel protein [Bacteroidota bacterium]
MKLKLFQFLLAVLFAAPAFAQGNKSWNLQQCVDYALQHNIQVLQSGINVEISKIDLLQSKANVLPNINASASHQYNFGQTIDRFTNQFANDKVLSQNFFLSSNIVLFQGLQNWNTIRQNLFALNASRYQVDKTKNDIALSVATAYLQVLFAQENYDNTKGQSDVTREQVKRTEKLVNVGNAAKGNLLDIQSQLAQEELAVVNAENQLSLSYLTLTQLMNLDSISGFRIDRPKLDVPSESILAISAEQVYQLAVSTQPGVKSAEMNYKSADKAVDVAWGSLSPSLTLSGGYGTGYSGASKEVSDYTWNGAYDTTGVTSGGQLTLVPHFDYNLTTIPFSEQLDNNLNKSFGFQLNIPIFNRLQVHTSIERAELQRENARLNLELSKQQLLKDIRQAHADAIAALSRYKASEKALDAMRESFKYTEQRFLAGLVNAIDFNTAKNNLARTESELLQARFDFIFKLKVLDYYQGKPISF